MKSRSNAGQPTAGRSLVALQVALSLVLAVVAALLSQSLLRLQTEHTGFALDQVTIQTRAVPPARDAVATSSSISTTAWSRASPVAPPRSSPPPSPGTRR